MTIGHGPTLFKSLQSTTDGISAAVADNFLSCSRHLAAVAAAGGAVAVEVH